MDSREAGHTSATPDGKTDTCVPENQPSASPPRGSILLVRSFSWLPEHWPQPRRLVRLAVATVILATAAWLVSWQGYGWYHLYEGKSCLKADHFREALNHFQIALEVWPDDPTTLFLAARAARRGGDLEVADRYLTKCQATRSYSDSAEFERVLLRATRGEIDAVGGYCQALLDQDHADTPLILEALALGELKLLRFAGSSAHLDRWLAMAPNHPQALFLKGRLQLQASNSQEAVGLLRRTVELDPKRDDARLALAILHLDLGQAQEALPHLTEVRRRQPHNVPVQARLAQALVLLGREQEAVALLDDVLRQRPDLVIALLERGKLALRADDLDKAEALLQEAAKREGGNRAVHYQLLQSLKRRGKDAQALAIQERLERIDRDATRMREIVTILLPGRRDDPDLQAELGAISLRVGATDDGLQWLHRSLERSPNNLVAHRALADHYYSMGQFGQAQQHRALAGITNDPAKK